MRFVFTLSIFLFTPFSVASSITVGTYSCILLDEANGNASTFTITEEALVIHSDEHADDVYLLGSRGDDYMHALPSEENKKHGIEYFKYKVYYTDDRSISFSAEIKYADSANLALVETIIAEAEAGIVMTFQGVTYGTETTNARQFCRLEE